MSIEKLEDAIARVKTARSELGNAEHSLNILMAQLVDTKSLPDDWATSPPVNQAPRPAGNLPDYMRDMLEKSWRENPAWKCPIGRPDCKTNCGSYGGCGG